MPASGIVTDSLGVFLCTLFSDDAVILLHDPRFYAVGLVVIKATEPAMEGVEAAVKLMAERFGSQPAEMAGLVSPSLGPCCHKFSDPAGGLPGASNDLWTFSRSALLRAGVRNDHIVNPRMCTACLDTKFFSRKSQGAWVAAGAVAAGVRDDGTLEQIRAKRRTVQGAPARPDPAARNGGSAARAGIPPSLLEEERRLNRLVRCPYGRNKVYVRSAFDGQSAETTEPVIALRCPILVETRQIKAGYNIVLKKYIEEVCCADYERCRAYREYAKRQGR
jgi:hypothetical protein